MSVLFDQLRISDDGQLMYIDAHVNKASYFEDKYISKITICTEDQVSETNPLAYGDSFIYQQVYEPNNEPEIVPVSKKVTEWSANVLVGDETYHHAGHLDGYGGVVVEYTPLQDAETNYLSIAFSGKFSTAIGENVEYAPKLVAATTHFNPTGGLNSSEVLFTLDGTLYEDKEHVHRVWQFNGHGEVKQNQIVHFYLYKQTALDTYELVSVMATDDTEFLHFFFHPYSQIPVVNNKELHLRLGVSDFNAAFNNLKYDASGNPEKDEHGNYEGIEEGKPVATTSFEPCDLSHNMFFVYIECEGSAAECTPCRLDEKTTLGVTFDYGILFNRAMNYTRELADDCNVSSNFIDFILNYEALKLAIETEHYVPAIKYWKWLIGDYGSDGSATYSTVKPCGCHG